ncbi:unnamed protein product (mitochondrion) [Plasmodiophora brassicae]|uniref:U4/U6.U5 small nuclear ribonucleoprotein 27kDa protein domain-containing protein n=1 Tax=Plasmodiophora brassicae TaxID=37360 RepID=A0A3P3YLR6_PLABS|nr:unnamed protein product [Plasmodiophora brassicae]
MVDARRRGFRGSQNATLSEQLRDVAAADAIAVAFPGRAAAKRPVTFAASAAAQSRQASKPEVDQPGAPAPRDARRSPSRSYSRERRRSDSRERNDRRDGKAPADGKPAPTKPTVAITDDMAPEEMMAALGLPTQLSSTKGKNVEDDAANMSGARVMSKRKYRQYMNRLGGFNRPLGKQF